MDESNKLVTQIKKPKVITNLKTILQCTAFCTICFDSNGELLHLDHSLVIEDLEEVTLTLREMLEAIFGNTQNLLASDYICEPCKSSAYTSCVFIHNTKKTALLYAKYLDQLDREMTELSARITGNEWKALIVLDDYAKINPKETIKSTSYVCNICGKSYSQRSFLIRHLKKHESGSLNINCPYCTSRPCIHEEYLESFRQQQNFKQKHMTCICGYEFGQTLECLIAHVNKEHFDIKANSECDETYLESHCKKHFEHHNKKHVCKSCFRKFRSTKLLENHMATCITVEKPFNCSKCPVLSETELINKLHMPTHSGNTKRPKHNRNTDRQNRIYKCQICDQVLRTKLELRSHINKHEKKPNLCMYCNKQFNSRQEYLAHVQSEEHRNNIPYGFKHHCEHCKYSANTVGMLKAHINRVHLNVRPFECEHCQKRYFDSTQLKNHIKTHTGRRSKVCDICGLHLAGPTALKKHRRLHTGENPYSCPYCDVKTVCASTLKTHVMRKHMEPTISCPLCDLKFHTMNNARGHVRKTHWKSKEKFDYTKLKGLSPNDYDFFRDRRKAVL